VTEYGCRASDAVTAAAGGAVADFGFKSGTEIMKLPLSL